MATGTEDTTETSSKSIFEDNDATPQPQPEEPATGTTVDKPSKTELIDTSDNKSTQDDEKSEQPSTTATSTVYPPNSLNDAKDSYLKTKSREQHKYAGGTRSPSQPKSNKIAATMNKFVDDVKQQMVDPLTDQLLSNADDAMNTFS